MSNETRHPDIEIYIKNRSLDQILDWLRTRCDALKPQNSTGNTYALMATMNGARVPIMIHEKAAGKAWTSLWFRSDATPWIRDLDCAEEISNALKTQVRCIVSGWQDGDDPDEWWRIEHGETEKITWRTE
ncbi:MAG: hypothetical protein GYB41_06530 [Oceanospirillales bacterium]|uniref:Uncharacterized protein n=1 Tax=Marinobacterium halophilum TaxID=267374 RepID=A0A2P8ESM6_9GAMM|nr:hypothetical protein [Marinobacterium halophilum]MBR9828281.1 hypothetical protein [Oceanospirillales bacterium]PSL12487.1 hypothetical protein CLV44_11716 [Marinobacterium halophilum]